MRTHILHLLAGTAATVLLSAAASAADLPVRAAPPPVIAAPIFTWTGFYAGVNAGAGWNTNSNGSVFVPGVGFVDNGGGDDVGFVGGGQIGYNYQFGSIVIGAEADIQWADLGGNNNNVFVPGVGFVSGNNNGMDWFGTVRGRLGLAFDRWMIYATGGFAYANGNNNRNGCFVGTTFVGCNNDDTSTGWTVGGGVEWALPVNWFGSSAVTFGVEGLYVNLDNNNNNDFLVTTPAALAINNRNNNNEFAVVRAKLNFKFGTY